MADRHTLDRRKLIGKLQSIVSSETSQTIELDTVNLFLEALKVIRRGVTGNPQSLHVNIERKKLIERLRGLENNTRSVIMETSEIALCLEALKEVDVKL